MTPTSTTYMHSCMLLCPLCRLNKVLPTLIYLYATYIILNIVISRKYSHRWEVKRLFKEESGLIFESFESFDILIKNTPTIIGDAYFLPCGQGVLIKAVHRYNRREGSDCSMGKRECSFPWWSHLKHTMHDLSKSDGRISLTWCKLPVFHYIFKAYR